MKRRDEKGREGKRREEKTREGKSEENIRIDKRKQRKRSEDK